MRITVHRSGGGIEETIRDLQAVPGKIASKGSAIVHRNGERTNRIARSISRKKAGPHGENFFKRITAEMTGPLTSEIGPSALIGTRYVGVGGSAGVDRDLDEALAKAAPKFHKDAADFMDGLL